VHKWNNACNITTQKMRSNCQEATTGISPPKHHNIKDELGTVLSDLGDIKARWKTYNESPYEDRESGKNTDSASGVDTGLHTNETIMPILTDEVRDAIRWLPRGKVAGYDSQGRIQDFKLGGVK